MRRRASSASAAIGVKGSKMSKMKVKSDFGQEAEEGNTEFKLSLHRASPERIRCLVTQLLFRLNEGGGRAVYRVGVSDDGRAEGLAVSELVSSLRTLREMAESLGAGITQCKLGQGARPLLRTAEVYVDANWSEEGEFGDWLNSVLHQVETGEKDTMAEFITANKGLGSTRSLLTTETKKERLPVVRRRFASEGSDMVYDKKDKHEPVRIAVIGSECSGKTTLIGVLATGSFDNGHGLARASVLRHGHEIQADGTTSDIVQVAACGVILVDLAGHEKYLKTTICGLTARAPDMALLVVDVTDRHTRRMTLEHLGVAIALRLPVIVVLTHADLLPAENTGHQVADKLQKLLAKNCKYDSDDIDLSSIKENNLFLVSSVSGNGYPELIAALKELKRRPSLPILTDQHSAQAEASCRKSPPIVKQQPLVRIHDARRVEYAGTVLEATVTGRIAAGQRVLLGPVFGQWHQVTIRSIRLAPSGQSATRVIGNGQSATFALAEDCSHFEEVLRNGRVCFTQEGRRRRAAGTVLLATDTSTPPVTMQFTAELLVLCTPRRRGALGTHFESVVHACTVRQSAKIVHVHGPAQELVAGTKAICTLRFLFFPEFLTPGTTIILRDGQTRAVGTVLTSEEVNDSLFTHPSSQVVSDSKDDFNDAADAVVTQLSYTRSPSTTVAADGNEETPEEDATTTTGGSSTVVPPQQEPAQARTAPLRVRCAS